jgi:putative ABC transport system permease protein
VRYAIRSLRRAPVFTTVVILTLGLGIGVNAAIFSVLNAIVLKPLGYAGAERLVSIHELAREIPLAPRFPVNAAHVEEWRRQTRSFEQIAMLREVSVTLTGSGEPARLTLGRVSASLFPMLGVRTRLGRTFLEEEDRAGQDEVVVLSHDLWARQFESAPDVIGRRVILDDRPYVIVGVLPPDFRFPRFSDLYPISITSTTPQLWKPFGLRDDERTPSGDFNYACIAKLRPGVSAAAAAAELGGVQSAIDSRLDQPIGLGAVVVPLAEQITGRVRTAVWLLQAGAAVVLVIVCVNVASLLIGRTTARRRELAVRRAVGASSGHLAAQMLTESAVLGAVAAALGFATTRGAMRVIDALAPADLPRVNEIRMDSIVWTFMLGIALLTTAIVGLVMAWRSTRVAGMDAVRHSARTASASRSALAMWSWLVATQTGLSAVSLVAAGLLLHSFANLMQVDKGFDAERVLSADLTLSRARYPSLESTTAFVRSLLAQLSTRQGIVSVGVVSQPPLAGVGGNNRLLAEGNDPSPAKTPVVDFRPVSPEYFKTMTIPLRRGRIFDDRDLERPVALVSASTARRVWPGRDPIGQRFRLGSAEGRLTEVIGVVGDVRGVSLNDDPAPTVYLPFWQRLFNRNRLFVLVKTTGDPAAAASVVRNAIGRIDPELAISEMRPMQDVIERSTAARRFQAMLLLLFGATALVLTILGTYAMVSYAVATRTTELGIRLALGEPRGRVLGHIVGDAARLAAGGLGAGLPIAGAAGYLMRGFLFGVAPHDAVTFVTVAVVLMVSAILAALQPAWRASRVDPVVTLRAA